MGKETTNKTKIREEQTMSTPLKTIDELKEAIIKNVESNKEL